MRSSLVPRKAAWDPFNLFQELERPLGRAIVHGGAWGDGRTFFAPDVDLRDEKDRIVVKADIPGIKKEDLSITVKDEFLTIKGERREAQEKKEKDYCYSERFEGSFVRTVELPSSVKEADVKASYRDGVLEITLPKNENARPREVKVQIQ